MKALKFIIEWQARRRERRAIFWFTKRYSDLRWMRYVSKPENQIPAKTLREFALHDTRKMFNLPDTWTPHQ